MSVSYASVDSTKMELTPMRVSFKKPGATAFSEVGGTLGNVLVDIKYEKAEIKADQLGTTVLDRRVKGLVMTVTTELTQTQDKFNVWKDVFSHSTFVGTALTGVTNTAASPALFTKTTHGLVAGDSITITSATTLSTGVSLNVTYYVLASGLTANDFELSLTLGGAAINATGSAGAGLSVQKLGPGTYIDFKSAVGDGDLSNAGTLLLHPLSQPDAVLDFDWTFYKACASAESQVTYGPDKQVTLKAVWNILPDTSVTPAKFARHGDASL
jgi:hypothetical protein